MIITALISIIPLNPAVSRVAPGTIFKLVEAFLIIVLRIRLRRVWVVTAG